MFSRASAFDSLDGSFSELCGRPWVRRSRTGSLRRQLVVGTRRWSPLPGSLAARRRAGPTTWRCAVAAVGPRGAERGLSGAASHRVPGRIRSSRCVASTRANRRDRRRAPGHGRRGTVCEPHGADRAVTPRRERADRAGGPRRIRRWARSRSRGWRSSWTRAAPQARRDLERDWGLASRGANTGSRGASDRIGPHRRERCRRLPRRHVLSQREAGFASAGSPSQRRARRDAGARALTAARGSPTAPTPHRRRG